MAHQYGHSTQRIHATYRTYVEYHRGHRAGGWARFLTRRSARPSIASSFSSLARWCLQVHLNGTGGIIANLSSGEGPPVPASLCQTQDSIPARAGYIPIKTSPAPSLIQARLGEYFTDFVEHCTQRGPGPAQVRGRRRGCGRPSASATPRGLVPARRRRLGTLCRRRSGRALMLV